MGTFHYKILQTTPPTSPPGGVLRDVAVVDPSPELEAKNHAALLAVMSLALQYQNAIPYGTPGGYRLVIGETCDNPTDPDYRSMNHAYPYMTQDGVQKVCALFDALISTTEVKKHGHGKHAG